MKRRKLIPALILLLFMLFVSIVPAYATPPSDPHIESGSAADGGNYFEFNATYLGENGWRDLKTPPHWVVETGEVAYCLDHVADSPHGEGYGKFDPAAIYSEKTYIGLLAILEHSFPYRNAGLTDKQIRYVTANAIRAWLRENAGIGYDFMLPSNNAVRPKTTQYQGAFNFYNQLLDKARNGSVINHTLTLSPGIVELTIQGNKLVGQATIKYSALNGKYAVNLVQFPSGTEVIGYTGNSGDVLTFKLPLSLSGETIDITNAFTGYDNRSPVNIFWLDNSSGHQAVAVPIVDQMNPVTTANIIIKSAPSMVSIIKHGKTHDTFIQGAVIGIYSAEDDTLIEELITDESGRAHCGKVTFGDYYAKEITAPVGYALDNTKQPFSITADNMEVELDLYNYPITGQVGVVKGSGWKPLKDAVIGVYSIEGTLIEELITDIQGSAISGPLEYGQYYIKEITAPPGYVKSDEELPFTIEIDNRIIWLGLENELITGRVQITKVDKNNELLQGAVFKIYDDYANTVDEIVTDENGIALSKILDYGEYEIMESKAPIGYNPNMVAVLINIENNDEIVEVTINNKPIEGRVEILKTGETDIPLQGAVFGVYDSDDSLIYELTTDENGKALSKHLVYGDYYLKEITPPVGYNLNEDIISFSINRQGQTVRFEASNTIIRGKVQILKTGEEDNPLQGAIFGIYDTNDVLIEKLTTNENGIATSQDIIYGDYYGMPPQNTS
ncbi:MAG: Cys-Gln thioester bond-forming surface protein, partial [Clostridiales bacterium]|nr:Cys-Gln thioester bond-forming surface protein [Clostridiales bacterium]